MTMYRDKSELQRASAGLTGEEMAAIVREAQRLRRQAVASVASALVRRLRRSLGRVSPGPPGNAIGRPV